MHPEITDDPDGLTSNLQPLGSYTFMREKNWSGRVYFDQYRDQ
jgi:hypothetical protein